MTDLRYIAERWIAQYGAETPRVVGEWASQLEGAPTAVQFLKDIANVAQGLLDHGPVRSGQSRDG